MRRIYLTITMTVLLLAGGHCAFAKKSKTTEVETAKFAKSDSTAEVSVLVQWPVNGDKIIVDSLRQNPPLPNQRGQGHDKITVILGYWDKRL